VILREYFSGRLNRFDYAADRRDSHCGLREHIPYRPWRSRMRSLVLVLGAGIFAIVPGHAQDAASGEKIFVQCKACHQIGENAKNAVGPVLNGLFGRKAGMIEGFSYSPANKNSGITWDEATFREYIKDPKAKIPGTKMVFPGLKDPKQIDDIVAYLKQFDSTGKKKAGIVPAGRKLAKVL
jgi:cytochrome c